jgi:hypothetical protein
MDLGRDGVRRWDGFRSAAGELWTAEHAYARAANLLSELVPRGDCSLMYDWRADQTLGEIGHTLSPEGVGWEPFPWAKRFIPEKRTYAIAERDPFANRATLTHDVMPSGETLEWARTNMWGPYGFRYQLRVALYERERCVGLVALLRRKGEFTRQEASLLEAVVPKLLDLTTAVRALGPVPLDSTLLGQVLDAFTAPAFLATQSGHVLYANCAAREQWRAAPDWLGLVLREPDRHARLAAVTRVEHEGASLFLVIPRARPVEQPAVRLPPSLARVADLAAQGLVDKEIAEALDMPLRTVRTFMARIYARLGVSNRVELRRVLEGSR